MDTQNEEKLQKKTVRKRNNNKKMIEEKAEAKVKLSVTDTEAPHIEAQHIEAQHIEAQHIEAQHIEAQHIEAPHIEAPHIEVQNEDKKENTKPKRVRSKKVTKDETQTETKSHLVEKDDTTLQSISLSTTALLPSEGGSTTTSLSGGGSPLVGGTSHLSGVVGGGSPLVGVVGGGSPLVGGTSHLSGVVGGGSPLVGGGSPLVGVVGGGSPLVGVVGGGSPLLSKKRGRKPKGGKIVETSELSHNVIVSEPNIILHLKCGKQDLEKTQPDNILTMKYDPTIENVENYQFEKNKGSDLNFFILSDSSQPQNALPSQENTIIQQTALASASALATATVSTPQPVVPINTDENEVVENKTIWKKLQKLSINLHNNNINDKKSACFWCTCDFDNPPIYIPKYELNDSYHCYGCFCSPECATASLFKEAIDTSTKFERYHLINHIYCKIYNYTKNVKPAPEPYYTLNKYYGNLTIQEYRKLLKNDRLILIVDKPFTRSLPELHEDNDDFILNNKTIPTVSNKYKSKPKPSKSTLLSENFNMSVK